MTSVVQRHLRLNAPTTFPRAHHCAPVFLPSAHFTPDQHRALAEDLPIVIEVSGPESAEARIYRRDSSATLRDVYETTGARTLYVAQPRTLADRARAALAPTTSTTTIMAAAAEPASRIVRPGDRVPTSDLLNALPTIAAASPAPASSVSVRTPPPASPSTLYSMMTPNIDVFVDLLEQARSWQAGTRPPPGSPLEVLANEAIAQHERSLREQLERRRANELALVQNAGHTPYRRATTSPLSATSTVSTPSMHESIERISAHRETHRAPSTSSSISALTTTSSLSVDPNAPDSPMRTSPTSPSAGSPMTVTPTSSHPDTTLSLAYPPTPSSLPVVLYAGTGNTASVNATPSAPSASDSAGPHFVFPPIPRAPIIPPAHPVYPSLQSVDPALTSQQNPSALASRNAPTLRQQRNPNPPGQAWTPLDHPSSCCPGCRRNIEQIRSIVDNHQRLSLNATEFLRQGIHFLEDLIIDLGHEQDTTRASVYETSTAILQAQQTSNAIFTRLCDDIRAIRAGRSL